MSEWEEFDNADVDWRETARTLQAELTRLRAGAVTVDRAALVAVCKTGMRNGMNLHGPISGQAQAEVIADAVIAHLAAQPVTVEVEYASGFVGEPESVGPVLTEAVARGQVEGWNNEARKAIAPAALYRRTVGPWAEVDE